MYNLLFIALEFPPIQAAGAFRALRYVSHLPKFGIRPIVICFNPAQVASRVHVVNADLASEVPSETPIFHLDASALEKHRRPFELPPGSNARGEHFYSLPALFSHIGQRYRIDGVFATCPPFNVDTIALSAKSFFQRPLIVDMRDAWSQWGQAPFRTWFHYRRVLARERKLLAAADAITSVTPQLVEMQRRIARKPHDCVHYIPNAYDRGELPTGEIRLEAGKPRYRIAYVGQFYFNADHETPQGVVPWYRKKPHRWLHYYSTQQRWVYRTPYFFFRAWRALRDAYPDLKDAFEFHYIGTLEPWLPRMAEEFGLQDDCTWHGFKPKQETNQFIGTCDLLLSTSIKVPGGDDYCLASKTFDYIAARKPVLGFVNSGSQRDFLTGANVAVLFDPDNAEECARRLKELVQHGFRKSIDTQFLEGFTALSTTESLARVVRGLIPRRSDNAELVTA